MLTETGLEPSEEAETLFETCKAEAKEAVLGASLTFQLPIDPPQSISKGSKRAEPFPDTAVAETLPRLKALGDTRLEVVSQSVIVEVNGHSSDFLFGDYDLLDKERIVLWCESEETDLGFHSLAEVFVLSPRLLREPYCFKWRVRMILHCGSPFA